MNFGFKNDVKRWKSNFKDDTYFSLFKKIQNFPGFFLVRIYRAFWAKIGQKKFNFQIFGDQKLKKKVFSWVVVFDFMVLILFQKVLWHHKMCSDSKISSQKIPENTLSYSKSMLSTHEKKLKKYHDSLQMAKTRQHIRGVKLLKQLLNRYFGENWKIKILLIFWKNCFSRTILQVLENKHFFFFF